MLRDVESWIWHRWSTYPGRNLDTSREHMTIGCLNGRGTPHVAVTGFIALATQEYDHSLDVRTGSGSVNVPSYEVAWQRVPAIVERFRVIGEEELGKEGAVVLSPRLVWRTNSIDNPAVFVR